MKELSGKEILERLASSFPEPIELAVWDYGGDLEIRVITGHSGSYIVDTRNIHWNCAGLPTIRMWIESSKMPKDIQDQFFENMSKVGNDPNRQVEKEDIFRPSKSFIWHNTQQGVMYWQCVRKAFTSDSEYSDTLDKLANEPTEAEILRATLDEADPSYRIDLRSVLSELNDRLEVLERQEDE